MLPIVRRTHHLLREGYRRAVARGVLATTINPLDVIRLLKKQWRQCIHCKCSLYISTISPDHILPLSLGGHHVLENIQLSCYSCNVRRKDKPGWKPREMRNRTWLYQFNEELFPDNNTFEYR